jgi:hypothetical protein
VALLVFATRTARARLVAAHVGERVGGRVAPVLDAAAFGWRRVLQLTRPVRLKARRNRAAAARRLTSRTRLASLTRRTSRVRAAALRRGLAAPGRRRVPAPVGRVPAALAAAASLAGAPSLAGTASLAGAPGAALPGTTLPGAALTAALGWIAPFGGRGSAERGGRRRRLRLGHAAR